MAPVARARSESARRVGRRIERPPAHWSLLALLLGGLLLLLGVQGLSTAATGRSATATTSASDPALRGSAAIWRVRGQPARSERTPGRDGASPSPSTTGLIRAGRRGSRPSFERLEVPATFFVVGEHVVRYPDVVASLEDEGFELGAHTFNHVDLATMPGWEQHLQMSMTDTAIVGAAGVRPRFFRPPYSGGPESITRANGGGVGLDGRPGPPDRALQLRLRGLAAARCLADRAQRDAARAAGRRDPLPRRRRRSLADRRRAATPGAASGAAGLSLRLALRAGRGAAARDPAAGLGVGAPSGRAPDRRPRGGALDHGRHARAADPDRRPGGSPGAGGRRLRPAPRPPLAAPALAAVHAAGLGDRPRLQRGDGDRARGEVAGGRRLPSARGGGRRRWLGRWHGRDRRGPRSAGGAGAPAAERRQGRGAERGAGGRVGRGDRHRRRRHRVRGTDPAPVGGAIRRPQRSGRWPGTRRWATAAACSGAGSTSTT